MATSEGIAAPFDDEYLALARERPDLFSNDGQPPFEILLDSELARRAQAVTLARLEARGLPRAWSRVGLVFEDEFFCILRDAVRFSDGSLGTYVRAIQRARGSSGVAVLPIFRSSVVLLRHYRHATRRWHIEIPRGFGVAGASEETNARRELHEEIGAAIDQLDPLGDIYPDSGLSSARVTLFCARIASFSRPETIEGIAEVLTMSVPDFEQAAAGGEITDGFSLAAYARARTLGLLP